MTAFGGFSASQLKKLQKDLQIIADQDLDQFLESCSKELAARLLAKVIKRTPVSQYPKSTGKSGGTLRRGWTAQTHEEAVSGGKTTAAKYVQELDIKHEGNMLSIDIINPVEYASYVEFGHRTANHKGWVTGQFMLTISEQEIQQTAPKILEKKIKKFLEGCV